MNLTPLDYFTFSLYVVLVVYVALRNSYKSKEEERTSEDFFLAGRSLPWWVIGTSLIASNISAEQLIGMSGSAFASGIAIVSYEWLSALALLVIAKWFLPIFLKMQIYSMPQFLEERFDKRISISLGIFWILVYIFVNLTSILYLGALTLQTILGIPILYSVVAMAILSGIFSIYGGLSAAAWTDFIQVAILFLGGVLITVIGLDKVGDGSGIITGFQKLLEAAPEKFHTVLGFNHPELPWLGVFFGGMWVANFSYWGFNQYITQRALAARNLQEARNGLLFASFLKILVPLIVVLPGVTAFVLYGSQIPRPDEAYPTLIKNLVPVGFTGLIIAALLGAILSSLNSMTNSTATIFSMDIYRKIKPDTSDRELVRIGRIVSAIALFLAVCIAPSLVTLKQAFQYIQEFTGMISPGVVVIFLLGLFWPRANSISALAVALVTIPVSLTCKLVWPSLAFLNRMGLIFLLLLLFAYIITVLTSAPDKKGTVLTPVSFVASTSFHFFSALIIVILSILYLYFW
ncbi:MAG: sodium/solute symporter [Spirochaetota bacterium]